MRPRVVLCAHGTSSHLGRAALSSLVNAVRRAAGAYEIADAFVADQHPLLSDVLAESGGRSIVVPVVLSRDVRTAAVLRDAAASSDLVRVTAPVGPDWVLAEIAVGRLIEAGSRPTDTIVMVAPEADGPRALADIGKAARLLSAVWGGPVHVGVVEGIGTPVEQALDVARAHQQRVVVSRYALTSGDPAAGIGRLGADVVTAPLLGSGAPDPRLVSLILARVGARVTGVGAV